MPNAAQAIATYIAAKDGNRPHLMAKVFTSDARLDMTVLSDAITFPGRTDGLDAMTDVLVRRFSLDNENVYTFCLTTPPDPVSTQYSCAWLVGMTRRADGAVRIGYGTYDWRFAAHSGLKVDRLAIVIEEMIVLPPSTATPVMDWLSALPYPWCPDDQVVATVPGLEGLNPIKAWLESRPTLNTSFGPDVAAAY